MDVEGIDSIDALGQILKGIFLDAASGGSQDSHIHFTQFVDVLHHLIAFQLLGQIFCTFATNNACNLHIGGFQQCLKGVLSNIAISYDGHSSLFHNTYILITS